MGAVPSIEIIRARAEAGAARFDQHDLNWALAINTNVIDMRYYQSCVLGQFFGNYTNGLETLGLTLYVPNDRYTVEHDVVQLGFDLAYDELHDENGGGDDISDAGVTAYNQLTNAWRNIVALRQRRGAIPTQRTAT